jgi:mannose-6-phosphate isomerase-like protein (cupin superfamily)
MNLSNRNRVNYSFKNKKKDSFTYYFRMDPHSATPYHYYKNIRKTYSAVEGYISIGLGAERKVLTPEKTIIIEKGIGHKVVNAGSLPAVYEVSLSSDDPEVNLGFKILSGLDTDGLVNPDGLPRDFMIRCLIEKMTGMRRAGLKSLVFRPYALYQARMAEKNGLKQKLINRYAGKTEDQATKIKILKTGRKKVGGRKNYQ